jgi:hypothetical protein
MKVNSLVKHKKRKLLGIGCVSKKLAGKRRVNFGLDGSILCSLSSLTEIDTTNCKTIELHELNRLTIGNSKELPPYVIMGNELRHYVGIGWVTHRVVTEDDLKKFVRVI